MKAAGTLRDVREGRIKAPHAVHTKWGYFEFYTLNSEWWVGNGCRSFSCTPDTPVFVPETVKTDPDLRLECRHCHGWVAGGILAMEHHEKNCVFRPSLDDGLSAFLRKQAD